MTIDETKPPTVVGEPRGIFDFTNGAYEQLGAFTAPTGVSELTFFARNGVVMPGTQNVYDGFFDAIINGPGGIDAAEILGEDNVTRLLEAVQNLNGIAFAQFMDATRIPLSSTVEIEATRTTMDTYRLFQSPIATRILQCLLGIIICSLLLAFWLIEMRSLLPKNPCSIAAIASLLVHSDLLNISPPSAENLSDKELEEVVFSGNLFSLGWWKDAKTGEKRWGIDAGYHSLISDSVHSVHSGHTLGGGHRRAL